MGPPKASSRPSTRWRPTPEQVMILEGLFKGGLTTPSAQQIQKITSQVKEYGKAETKNVFYWFQNHKAREKQKLRRRLHHHQQQQHNNNNNNNNNNVLFYYFYLPPTQFPTGLCPILPAHQALRDIQWRGLEKPEMVTSNKEEIVKEGDFEDGSSLVNVTWLTTNSDSTHHQSNHQERLKTLQLFPTTPPLTTTTTTASCSTMSS